MDSFLSESEDEIAFGPITLQEIKKHLELKPKKMDRRHSDSRYCKFYTPSTTFSEDTATKSNASSPYYTPNESLHVSNTDAFLHKMNKVINEDGAKCKEDPVVEKNDATFIFTQNNSYEEHENSESETSNQSGQVWQENHSETEAIQTVCTSRDNISPIVEKAESFIYLSSESEMEDSIIVVPDESFAEVAVKTENIKEEELSNDLSDSQVTDYDLSYKEDEMESLTYSTNNSLRLNDTLEEMEVALKQGLDYKMAENVVDTSSSFAYSEAEDINRQKSFIPTPSKYSQKENIPLEANIFKIPSKVPKAKKPSQFKDIISPVKAYICNSNSPKEKKYLTTNKPILATTSAQFKDIISPVRVYIKNSPSPILKTNVAGTNLPYLHNTPSDKKVVAADSALPDMLYKKRVGTNLHSAINLPLSIQKMVPNANVDVRLTVKKPAEKKVAKNLLLRENLTLSESTVLEDLAEASVILTKQALID